MDGKTINGQKAEAKADKEAQGRKGAQKRARAGGCEAEQRKCEEYKNDLKRLAAEFDNYKKRVEKQSEISRQLGREDALLQFLIVRDELSSALSHVRKSKDESAKKGFELLAKKLDSAFSSFGVEEIKCGGEPDHNLHEVMLAVEGKPRGKIAQVLRKGYKIGSRLLRPAQVSVYSGEKNEDEKTDSGEKPADGAQKKAAGAPASSGSGDKNGDGKNGDKN